jgi:hypothetical protein
MGYKGRKFSRIALKKGFGIFEEKINGRKTANQTFGSKKIMGIGRVLVLANE